jgi:hypothetical protein
LLLLSVLLLGFDVSARYQPLPAKPSEDILAKTPLAIANFPRLPPLLAIN